MTEQQTFLDDRGAIIPQGRERSDLERESDAWIHSPGGRHIVRDIYALAAKYFRGSERPVRESVATAVRLTLLTDLGYGNGFKVGA